MLAPSAQRLLGKLLHELIGQLIFDFNIQARLADDQRSQAKRFHPRQTHAPTSGSHKMFFDYRADHFSQVLAQQPQRYAAHLAHEVCISAAAHRREDMEGVVGLNHGIQPVFQNIGVAPVDKDVDVRVQITVRI